jgi:putative spermidine/putrescine transport system permease protein
MTRAIFDHGSAVNTVTSRPVLWLVPGLVLLLIGFVGPLAAILWTSLLSNGGTGTGSHGLSLDAYTAVFGSAVFWDILYRTVRAAIVVTLMCIITGYPFAYLVATRARRFAGPIMALVAVPYLTSVLIRSYAWVAILGDHGPINRALLATGLIKAPLRLVFSDIGNDIGLLHVLLPMLILPVYAAMQRISPALMQAAANLGATPTERFVTIFLPLSMPGLTAGSALVFLTALGAYVTPALLGAPGDYLLAQAIQVRIATLADFAGASAQAIVLLTLVVGLLFLCRSAILPEFADMKGANDARPADALSKQPARARWIGIKTASSGWMRAAFRSATHSLVHVLAHALRPATATLEKAVGPVLYIYGALLLFALLAPMVVVVMIAFTSAPYLTFPPPGYSIRWFAALASDADWLGALVFSLEVAAVAACGALLIGTPYALAIARGKFAGRRAMWLAAISPMVLPHIVIGLGMLLVSVPLGVNGTATSFWIAYMVIALPFVITILLAAFSRFDINLERAAANLGAPALQVFVTVTIPLLATSFTTAFLFAFLAGFDDLIISQFLSSPEHTTLAMRMWQDIQLEISPKTAVVGAMQLFVLSAGALLLGARMGWRGLMGRYRRRRAVTSGAVHG